MYRIFANMPPVTKNLLIINVIIWAAMNLVPAIDFRLTNWCAMHYITSPGFNVAQFITYMFMQKEFLHLFFNMFALVMFGGIIERAMNSKRFLFYYISCGIFAALVQMAAYAVALHKYNAMFTPAEMHQIIEYGWQLTQHNIPIHDPTLRAINSLVNSPMIGASGAVYGIILAFGMLFPNQPIYLMFIPIPIKAKWIVIAYGIIELTYGIGGSASSNVAHFAHLGGMIAGIFLILYWKKKGVFNNHWFF